jgi:hypothetical protein
LIPCVLAQPAMTSSAPIATTQGAVNRQRVPDELRR